LVAGGGAGGGSAGIHAGELNILLGFCPEILDRSRQAKSLKTFLQEIAVAR
jgi:hypothetical protein